MLWKLGNEVTHADLYSKYCDGDADDDCDAKSNQHCTSLIVTVTNTPAFVIIM